MCRFQWDVVCLISVLMLFTGVRVRSLNNRHWGFLRILETGKFKVEVPADVGPLPDPLSHDGRGKVDLLASFIGY